jgi:hypothetical protein
MRPRPLLLAGVIAALAAGGCGGSSQSKSNGVAQKSPREALAAAQAAVVSATSVRIVGSGTKGGAPFSLNLRLATGKGAEGQIAEGGLSFRLIQIGDTLYINGSPAFYRHFGGQAAAQLFQGKWLKAPVSTPEFTSISSLTDLRTLTRSLLNTSGSLRSAGTNTIGGQKVAAIEDPAQGGTLYVAATGKPYPLELEHTGSEAGRITFSDWNAPVSLTAPAGAIDITQLHSAG